jgi:hypothetical protein
MESVATNQLNQMKLLNNIKSAISNDKDIIFINGNFQFTKGKSGKSTGYVLRDRMLEKDVVKWINNRTSFDTLIRRYKEYDSNLKATEWPRHYATRFINVNGNAAEGENIFMFFPEVLGLRSNHIEDYFGFEFVDVWTSVFDEVVFPCMRRVFDVSSQLIIYRTLRPVLEKTIYLASVFMKLAIDVAAGKFHQRSMSV